MPPMASRATAIAASDSAPCVVCGEPTTPWFAKRGWTFVRCASCGMVSLSPLPTADEIAAQYETSYAEGAYATFAAADEMRRLIARHRLAELRRDVTAPEGAWLDVGCSTGTFLVEARAAGLAAEGLELSAQAVAQARAQGLTVHQGAVEGFAPRARYAAVTAFDVIEHLADPALFLRRVAAWLDAGGLLALTLPDMASPTARGLGRSWFYYAPPFHVHYFTPPTIARLLATSGFRDVRVRPIRKPLTLDYAAAAATHLMPALGTAARLTTALVPGALRSRPLLLPLGEMLVTARPGRGV
jgi:SAM-dependent methyltransferase